MNREVISADLHQGGPMTGNEWYPIMGDIFSLDVVNLIVSDFMRKFKGLPLMGGCNAKAQIVHAFIAPTEIIVGGIKVWNRNFSATYEHTFNPPLEQHWWLQYNQNPNLIIDFALPGVILRGLKEHDEIGPYLEGRDPVILAGEVPDWIEYTPKAKVVLV
jgi:hypothetical protein